MDDDAWDCACVGPLLHLLERRYDEDKIYTFTGDILISINPYKFIDGLYVIPAGAVEDYELSHVPHVYAVAEKSYRMMRNSVCGCDCV